MEEQKSTPMSSLRCQKISVNILLLLYNLYLDGLELTAKNFLEHSEWTERIYYFVEMCMDD